MGVTFMMEKKKKKTFSSRDDLKLNYKNDVNCNTSTKCFVHHS